MADEKPIDEKPKQTEVVPQAAQPKPGDKDQPSIEEWGEAIRDDLALALGKIKQLPAGALPEMQRIGRLLTAHLGGE